MRRAREDWSAIGGMVREEFAYAFLKHPVGRLEGVALFRCLDGRRVGNAPMMPDRLARPDGADLAGRIVADGDQDIERRRTRCGKFVPALRPEFAGRIAALAKKAQRGGMDLATRKTAGRKSAESARAFLV